MEDSENKSPDSPYEYNPAVMYPQGGAAGQSGQAAGVGQPAYAAPSQQQAWAGQGYEQQPVAQPVKKKLPGWFVPLVIVIVLALITALAVNACTVSVTTSLGLGDSSATTLTADSVAVLELDGDIAYDGSVCSPEGFKEMLDQAEANSHIKALVLRVNSGGGTATAGEEMTVYLQDFSKPVVVSCAATNASAAYMISSQADYIYTARSSAVGAIGVAMQMVDYSGLMELLGINTENITSSDSKDSTYGTRSLTDEERAYYQAQVDQINDMFIQFVAEGRGMTVDQVKALATGLTFTGVDAVSNGLADDFGTLEDACDKAAELASLSTYDMVYLYQDSSALSSLLSTGATVDISAADVVAALKELNE